MKIVIKWWLSRSLPRLISLLETCERQLILAEPRVDDGEAPTSPPRPNVPSPATGLLVPLIVRRRGTIQPPSDSHHPSASPPVSPDSILSTRVQNPQPAASLFYLATSPATSPSLAPERRQEGGKKEKKKRKRKEIRQP